MEIKMVNPSSLVPHPKNPRVHPKSAIKKLADSIREFGWTNPVLVSADGYVLAGHARLKAAQEAGVMEVPVVFLPLEGAKAEAYLIADNRLQDETDWDRDLLGEMLRELKDEIDLKLTGFDERELKKLLELDGESYTKKIATPHYEITGACPALVDLCDNGKTLHLVNKIRDSGLTEEEKDFLIQAAQRHLVFHYGKIAEYYAHADVEMQELMEDSALVIIDYESAIEKGYFELSAGVADLLGENDA